VLCLVQGLRSRLAPFHQKLPNRKDRTKSLGLRKRVKLYEEKRDKKDMDMAGIQVMNE
jgi:hypothetical protein